MKTLVEDIMVTDVDIIDSQAPIENAINMMLNAKIRPTGHKTQRKQPSRAAGLGPADQPATSSGRAWASDQSVN